MKNQDIIPTGRLLFVNLSKGWGGGEKWFLTFANYFHQSGYNTQLMVWPNEPLEAAGKKAGIPTFSSTARFLSLFNPFQTYRIYKQLKQLRPDVIFLNASHELKVFGLIAKWAGVREIIFPRSLFRPIRPHILNKWYLRNVITGLTTPSKVLQEQHLELFPFLKKKRLLVLNNFVDTESWNPPKIAPLPFRIGIVSRLSSEKGVARGIETFSHVIRDFPKAELVIIGEGPEKASLELLVKEKNLTQQIKFLGFTDQVQAQLATCSIFFLPSYGEGLSIALLEAMALAIPPVVFDVSSMDEVIVHGQSGFIASDNDTEAAAQYLVQLLNDTDLRDRMASTARQRVLEQFTFGKVSQQLMSWLESGGFSSAQSPPESNT